MTGYGVFLWSRGAWQLWHIAPTKATADDVASALRAFTREAYYVYGPGYRGTGFGIFAYLTSGARVTWGESLSEWFAWHVRDALSQSLWDYRLRTGRTTSVDPETLYYVGSDGRQKLTMVSRPWNT